MNSPNHHQFDRSCETDYDAALRAITQVRCGPWSTPTRWPAVSWESEALWPLSRTLALVGIVSVTVLYVAFLVPSRIVSCWPLTDWTKPRLKLTVAKPFLVAMTASPWTARRTS